MARKKGSIKKTMKRSSGKKRDNGTFAGMPQHDYHITYGDLINKNNSGFKTDMESLDKRVRKDRSKIRKNEK